MSTSLNAPSAPVPPDSSEASGASQTDPTALGCGSGAAPGSAGFFPTFTFEGEEEIQLLPPEQRRQAVLDQNDRRPDRSHIGAINLTEEQYALVTAMVEKYYPHRLPLLPIDPPKTEVG